jgi:hypothetical protein
VQRRWLVAIVQTVAVSLVILGAVALSIFAQNVR